MKPIRVFALLFAFMLLAVPAFAGKSKGKSGGGSGGSSSGGSTLSAPILSCSPGASGKSINLTVTAGSSGAPAGFSVHWILKSELSSSRYSSNNGGGDHDDDDDGDDDDGGDNDDHGDNDNDDGGDNDDHGDNDNDDGGDNDDHGDNDNDDGGDNDDHGDDGDDDDGGVDSTCQGSFSGNASGHVYRLDAGESVTINIDDSMFDTPGASSSCENVPLLCGRQYEFKAFAHATSSKKRSAWSASTVCSTGNCGGSNGGGGDDGGPEFGCTLTRTNWLERGPTASPDENLWPVMGLTIGNVFYSNLQLESILAMTPGSNGLIALAQQLIAVKLNVANGASANVATATVSADSMIGNLVVPPVGSGSLSLSSTASLTLTLQNYNNGVFGPGACE